MPYENESASKASYIDIIKNPDVQEFLSKCEYIQPPSGQEAEQACSPFKLVPDFSGNLPQNIISWDGSPYESSPDLQSIPSTRYVFVKLSGILINTQKMRSLRNREQNLVDPFEVARLMENRGSLHFVFPSSNLKYKSCSSVAEGFRKALHDWLSHPRTALNSRDSIESTLFFLASMRPDKMATNDPRFLKIHSCPACQEDAILTIENKDEEQFCPKCGAAVHPTDCLRLHEAVTETHSNQEAAQRFMMTIEHLIAIHYIKYFLEEFPQVLGNMAFFIDGPLALFGQPAWLHSSIMKFINGMNDKLNKLGLLKPTIIGLQKSGQVVDFTNLIANYIPNDTIAPVTDEYRYKYILQNRDQASKTFGYETYYGQDFIYKTKSGKIFVFGVPYPFADKNPV
ncbi:MAG: zinc ribbon domain-containing protein, partial [Syntrophobacteraceae bacterium]